MGIEELGGEESRENPIGEEVSPPVVEEATKLLDNALELSTQGWFRRRVALRAMAEAVDIINEDPMTPDHATRVLWAAKVLDNPEQYGIKMAPIVALDTGVITEYTESSTKTKTSITEETLVTASKSAVDAFCAADAILATEAAKEV